MLEFPPRLLLTAIDNYCELVSRSRSPFLSSLVELTYYENGALPLVRLPSFARAIITIASWKISPRGQGVSAAVVLSSLFLRLFVSYRPLTARSRAEQVGGLVPAARKPHQEIKERVIITISADCHGGECVHNPGANKSTVRGTVAGEGFPGGGGLRPGEAL